MCQRTSASRTRRARPLGGCPSPCSPSTAYGFSTDQPVEVLDVAGSMGVPYELTSRSLDEQDATTPVGCGKESTLSAISGPSPMSAAAKTW
jgi:hypothetical protein